MKYKNTKKKIGTLWNKQNDQENIVNSQELIATRINNEIHIVTPKQEFSLTKSFKYDTGWEDLNLYEEGETGLRKWYDDEENRINPNWTIIFNSIPERWIPYIQHAILVNTKNELGGDVNFYESSDTQFPLIRRNVLFHIEDIEDSDMKILRMNISWYNKVSEYAEWHINDFKVRLIVELINPDFYK